MMRRNPGFTLLAVAVFGVGIGATTTIFSLVRGVLLRPLPFDHPDEIVQINTIRSSRFGEFTDQRHGYSDLPTLREMAVFRDVAAIIEAGLNNVFYLTGVDEPERVRGALVSPSYFSLLSAPPLFGRTFSPTDMLAGETHLAVLSHSIWMRRFGGDPNAIGIAIQLNGEPYTVLGVMPPTFHVPRPSGGGGYASDDLEIWVPLRPDHIRPNPASGTVDRVIARLDTDISISHAEAELNAVFREGRVQLVSIHDQYVGHAKGPLAILSGVVGLVMLLVCTNVAGIQLARIPRRHREIVLRTALGASRGRLIQQLLIEGMMLSLVGGVVGVMMSIWSRDLVVAMAPESLPRLREVHVDLGVGLLAITTAGMTGILTTLLPAWSVTRQSLETGVRQGRTLEAGKKSNRFRDLLVISQIGLAFVLITASGLMIRSFVLLNRVDPGFAVDNLLVADVYRPSGSDSSRSTVDFFSELTTSIGNLPGVEAVTITTSPPLRPRDYYHSEWRRRKVDEEYFNVLRIPIVSGRNLQSSDRNAGQLVVVINETLAREQFSGTDPLDASLEDYRIVGIVGDVRHTSIAEPPLPAMYALHSQEPDNRMSLIVRTSGEVPVPAFASGIREAVWALDPNQPVGNIDRLSDILNGSDAVRSQRFNTRILAALGAVAVLIALLGVYGVMSQFVTLRTREIGVRIALGAHNVDVFRLVLTRATALGVSGLAIGVLGALGLTRFLESLLFETKPVSLPIFIWIGVGLFVVMLLASYVPARRAVRVDPVSVLRSE